MDGGMDDYKFKVTGVFRKCLDRQVGEGLRILECEKEGGTTLNSKNEWLTRKIVETLFRQQSGDNQCLLQLSRKPGWAGMQSTSNYL